MRVMRVSRLFKLMKAKQLEGIQKIIKTLIFSFPSLMNVLVLLFLIYFIFSILAVNLFSSVPFDINWNNKLVNFNTFDTAIVTLFRCSTGEDWHMFMYVYGDVDGLYTTSRLYFLVYIFLSSYVMLNMF